MEFLEFQLFEPLSFRLYSLSASSTGSSLLTCIAVLAAAAVGFWRIRNSGSKADGSDASALFTVPTEEKTQQKVALQPVVPRTESEAVSPSCSFDKSSEIVGTPKVRFITYFEKEDRIGCCQVEDEEEPAMDIDEELDRHEEVELPGRTKEVEMKWESLVIKRRGDLGWYSYQDMAALNGNVVRLWDGESPRRRKGSIAISSF